MSDWTFSPWSDISYAPHIPHELYFTEKVSFAGPFLGAIFYGIVVVLFSRCMGTLLNPVERTTGGIKWALVVHTTAMFSLVTVYSVITGIPSDYIENREYPGDAGFPPGPFGHGLSRYTDPVGLFTSSIFYLNQWLADGLLLYRCYIIYGMNYWAIAFPGLMYLATLVMGIFIIYENCRRELSAVIYFANCLAVPYYSIALSLNSILTLMIVIRLALHSKYLRDAMGPLSRPDRLYITIITILIESSALYAITFIGYIGPWWAKESLGDALLPLLSQVQVIAPFLIILRVASRTAMTTDIIATADIPIGSLRFASQGGLEDHEPLSGGHAVTTLDTSGDTSNKRGIRVETTVDEIRSSQ